MHRKSVIMLLCFCLLLSSGCWDRKEINESFITIAVGVDTYPGNKLQFTEQIPIPPAKPKITALRGSAAIKRASFLTVSTVGSSFTEGARKVHLQIPRAPLWQHATCYLFSEDFARKGFSGEVDWLYRNRNIRKIGYMFVTRNTSPADVLNVADEIEPIPAIELVSMVQNQDSSIGIYTPAKLGDFLIKTVTRGVEPAVPGVKIVDENGKKRLTLSGTAVFKSGKLVGWLNEEESRGYRWLRPTTIIGGVKQVRCPVCGKPVVLETIRSRCTIAPTVRNGQITMNIKIKEEGNFYEQKCTHQLLTPETISILNHEAAQLIESQVRAAVSRAQNLDSDIFGFGEALNSVYPEEWDRVEHRWAEVFPSVKIRVEVQSDLRRSSLTTRTLEYKF